jgi:hypothetical protein
MHFVASVENLLISVLSLHLFWQHFWQSSNRSPSVLEFSLLTMILSIFFLYQHGGSLPQPYWCISPALCLWSWCAAEDSWRSISKLYGGILGGFAGWAPDRSSCLDSGFHVFSTELLLAFGFYHRCFECLRPSYEANYAISTLAIACGNSPGFSLAAVNLFFACFAV